MQVIQEIFRTVAVVVLCILGVIAALYLVLLFIDWWLKFRTGGREQEGLSNLLVDAYKNQKEPQESNGDEEVKSIPPEK